MASPRHGTGGAVLAFALASWLGQTAVGAAETIECPAMATADELAPEMTPAMAKIQMHQPMPGEMQKPGTMKEDVSRAAMQKSRCMNDMLAKEQSVMDGMTDGSNLAQ